MDTRDVNVAIKALKDGKRVGKNGIPHLYCILGDDGNIYLHKKVSKNKWIQNVTRTTYLVEE